MELLNRRGAVSTTPLFHVVHFPVNIPLHECVIGQVGPISFNLPLDGLETYGRISGYRIHGNSTDNRLLISDNSSTHIVNCHQSSDICYLFPHQYAFQATKTASIPVIKFNRNHTILNALEVIGWPDFF